MAELSDIEATRLCAVAMGLGESKSEITEDHWLQGNEWIQYDPLHDDAQAMALVKRFDLHIGKTLRTPDSPRGEWFVSRTDKHEAFGPDLNRAIVMTVAHLQAAGEGKR